MTLTKQYKAYVDATLSAVDKIRPASRMPKGFSAEKFKDDLVGALKLAKPSQFTRASYQKRTRR
jgi:hypothetical protein